MGGVSLGVYGLSMHGEAYILRRVSVLGRGFCWQWIGPRGHFLGGVSLASVHPSFTLMIAPLESLKKKRANWVVDLMNW